MKNSTGILLVTMQITLGSTDILATLILPIHRHGMSFHLFVLSSASFINILNSFHVFPLLGIFFLMQL